MRKTFTKIAGCAALGLLMCFNAPAITKAAVKTVPAKNGVYNAKVDMNGDGKADAIKIFKVFERQLLLLDQGNLCKHVKQP